MARAFGIINFAGNHIQVEGLQKYRPVGAFSFLGRYRVIDFQISNMSNSGIDHMQVYIRRKPQSLTAHLGTGRHYNINSKRGRLRILYAEMEKGFSIYSTDIASYIENMEFIEQASESYVVIAPSYMIYAMDYSQLLESHIESGADITLLYHSVDNAKESFLNCNVLNLNKQKGVLSMEPNHGNAKNRNIFMETYVMKKELFIELVEKAHKLSSMYTLSDIVNDSCSEFDIRGVAHRGYFASISDFKSYYDANISLIDIKTCQSLFNDDWPIYTRTNDSCPTQYFESASTQLNCFACCRSGDAVMVSACRQYILSGSKSFSVKCAAGKRGICQYIVEIGTIQPDHQTSVLTSLLQPIHTGAPIRETGLGFAQGHCFVIRLVVIVHDALPQFVGSYQSNLMAF